MASETTETIGIDGMHCEHCVAAVRDALEAVEGVRLESVEIGQARLRYRPDETSRQQIEQAIEEAGYQAQAQTA